MQQWQLQDAKAKFSDLVKQVQLNGPQAITVRGQPAAIILSAEDFYSLTKPKTSIVDFFQRSPLKGVKLDLKRDVSTDRDVSI